MSHSDCWQIPATSASFSLSVCLLCFVTGNANALDLAPLVLLSCWQLWECCSELLGQCFPGDVSQFCLHIILMELLLFHSQGLVPAGPDSVAVVSSEDRRLWHLHHWNHGVVLGWKGAESSCLFSSAG